ncbi:MAG: hypothetical protein JXR62_04845 [Bacilli bacterium]|nr:hypothetical protein [Bacilli bacterium]
MVEYMDIGLIIDVQLAVEQASLLLGKYGFLIVIVFGIMHPLFENPLSLFNLALAISLLGIPIGYLIVFLSNVIGIILLYWFAMKFNQKSNHILFQKEISQKLLTWIRETSTWKHIIVIGVPFIPTYPIKLAVPLSNIGFKKYCFTLIGAYLFLFFGNTLMYFGILGFVTDNIPNSVSFCLILLFVIYLYFGNRLFTKEKLLEK